MKEEDIFCSILAILKDEYDNNLELFDEAEKSGWFTDKLGYEKCCSLLQKLIDKIEWVETDFCSIKETEFNVEKNNEGWIPINKDSKMPLSGVDVLVCSNCGMSILHWSSLDRCWKNEWNKKIDSHFIAWRPLPNKYITR